MNEIVSEHNKEEYPPMHTAEHILNQTMVRMFACTRSKNTHIERKKSKCDYKLNAAPTEEEILLIEKSVNDVINQNLDVTVEYCSIEDAKKIVDISKLPENFSESKLRIVRIGNYDTCACAGAHVSNTSEIGRFNILSHNYDNGIWRVRFKLDVEH